MNKKPQSRPGKIKGIIVTPEDLKKAEQESLLCNRCPHSAQCSEDEKPGSSHCFDVLQQIGVPTYMKIEPKKKPTIDNYLTIKMPRWAFLLIIPVIAVFIWNLILAFTPTTNKPTTNVQKEIVWELTSKDSSTFMQQDGEKAKKIVTFYYEEK